MEEYVHRMAQNDDKDTDKRRQIIDFISTTRRTRHTTICATIVIYITKITAFSFLYLKICLSFFFD